MTTFIHGEHTFDEYKAFVNELSAIYNEIPSEIEMLIEMGMYKIQREELVQALMGAGAKHKERLVAKLISDYQSMCKE